MDYVSDLLSLVLGLIGLEKAVVKETVFSVGLGPVWEALEGSLFHPFALINIAICLVLERLWCVRPRPRAVTPSMVLDYTFPLLGAVTYSVTGQAVLVTAIVGLYQAYLPFLQFDLLSDLPLWSQAVGYFLAVDFVFYVSHHLHHRVTVLWYLHAIHHSQEDLNPLTPYRVYPLEGVTKALIRTAPFMVFGGTATTVFWFTFINSFWGFFIHANIRTNLGFLKYVLVTPQYHRVHHSIEERHFDRNFGERLTLWDWLFGTMWLGFDDYPATGVKGFPIPKESDMTPWGLLRSWWRLTLYPFRRMWVERRL